MGFLKISVLQLVSSLSDFLFYFSLQKNNNNKSFLFRHSNISYLRNRKLTLGCYLNINPKNWKLKTKFSIFIFKKWIFTVILFFNIQNLTWKLDTVLNWKLGWKSIFNEKMLWKIDWTKYTRTVCRRVWNVHLIFNWVFLIEKWILTLFLIQFNF